MDFGLKGKKAIVLAASKGLGRAAAEALAAEGCYLAICARNSENLGKAAKAIKGKFHVPVLTKTVDIYSKADLDAFFSYALEQLGGVDILVTNAGGPPVKNFEETTDDEWHYWYNVTFMGVVRSVRHVLPAMKQQRFGRIVNITSVSVKSPVERLIYSNTLRLAVVGLAKSLSMELGPFGITVNNVAPGYHLTDGLERIVRKRVENGESRDAVLAQWEEKIPLRRLGVPEDLAATITFLASERASYITGTTIPVDGGLYSGTM